MTDELSKRTDTQLEELRGRMPQNKLGCQRRRQAPQGCTYGSDSNGARTVIVEDASRFSSELMKQEQGILELARHWVNLA